MSELRESLISELADMNDAERQLLKAMPQLHEAAGSAELKSALESHREETESQVDRLKHIFTELGQPPKEKKCQAMQGLIAEAEQRIAEDAGDAALICLLQKMEHYEIASYGTLRSWASVLEEDKVSDMLADTLDEEKAFDERLTEIADSTINIEAAEDEAAEREEPVVTPKRTRRRR